MLHVYDVRLKRCTLRQTFVHSKCRNVNFTLKFVTLRIGHTSLEMNVGLGKAPAKASSIRSIAEHTSPSHNEQRENANTPNRLKHRALLKLEPRTRMGKGRARTSQRTSTKHEGKRTALTLLALPLQCASDISIRLTPQTLHQKTKRLRCPPGNIWVP